jgi:ATP-dependent protease ClpP protease subunit
MLQLPKLLRDNADRPRDFRVVAKGDEAEIYIYDVIGEDFWTGGGVTAAKFLKAVDESKASTIHLRINSPGGDVFEARAIVSAMQRSSARFVAHVDSLAASAASVIAVAADEVVMAPGAMLMIHNAWTLQMGDKNAMLETASLLEKIDGTIADQYADKTGASREDMAALMDAETWMEADDAIARGFADSLEPKAEKAKNAWNLAAYANAPKDAAPIAMAAEEAQAKFDGPAADLLAALSEVDDEPEQQHAARERELRLLDLAAA